MAMVAAQGHQVLRQCRRFTTPRTFNDASTRWLYQLQGIRPFQSAPSRSLLLGSEHRGCPSHFCSSVRNFSDAKTKPSSMDQVDSDSVSTLQQESTTQEEEENVLADLVGKSDSLTTGQALLQLNLKRSPVYPGEMVALCSTARAGYPRDARIIQFALRQFKRSRGLLLDKHEATVAVEAMMKALLTRDAVVPAKVKLDASLFVLQSFLDTSTGLYFATPMPPLDDVLTVLLEGVQEENLPRIVNDDEQQDEEGTTTDKEGEIVRKRDIRKRFRKLGLVPTATPPKTKKQEIEPDEMEAHQSQRARETTLRLVELLCQRKERPYRLMKRRAARAYRKQIRIHHGPTPRTVETCAAILQQLCGPAEALKLVVQPCLTARCPVPDNLIQGLTTAIEQEQQQEGVQEEESSQENDAGDQDESESNNDEPQEDSESNEDEPQEDSDEEKKD